MPVQFEVYTNTKLLWQVGYDNVTSEHVFTGELLMLNGTAVQNQDIKIFLNETLVTTLRTNETGFVEYRRHFDAGDETITYNVQATFEGTDAQQATLNSTTFDGEDYTVCTVTYFEYKPSANMTTVTIEPHATEVAVPIQSPEEMQQEAAKQGLETWGPDSFSIFPPFFKLHARAAIDWLDLDVQAWAGFLACGIDSCLGLGRLLSKAFEGLVEAEINVLVGTIISSVTSVATLFVGTLIAATISQFTIGGYFATLALYFASGSLALIVPEIIGVYDPITAKAILYGIGFALLGLLVGAIAQNFMVRSFPAVLRQEVVGGDPVLNGVKQILNSLLLIAMTAEFGLCACIFFINPLMWPFAAATGTLAVLAIYLASLYK
jgi:hypothetical protein